MRILDLRDGPKCPLGDRRPANGVRCTNRRASSGWPTSKSTVPPDIWAQRSSCRACSGRGRVASRIDLLREVWGHQAIVRSRTVDAHIAELRRELEADPSKPKHILTVWKVGYRLQI